jgi:pyruvate-formate lyase-activating enzyme
VVNTIEVKYVAHLDGPLKRGLEHFTDRCILNIGATTGCNLKCVWCLNKTFVDGQYASEMLMSYAQVLDLIKSYDPRKTIIGFGGNEPTTNLDTFRLAQQAREHGFLTSIATNGVANSSIVRQVFNHFHLIDLSIKCPPYTLGLRRYLSCSLPEYCEYIFNFLDVARIHVRPLNVTVLAIPEFIDGYDFSVYRRWFSAIPVGSSIHVREFYSKGSALHSSGPGEVNKWVTGIRKLVDPEITVYSDPCWV